jgi:hypothetical protein
MVDRADTEHLGQVQGAGSQPGRDSRRRTTGSKEAEAGLWASQHLSSCFCACLTKSAAAAAASPCTG